MNIPIKHPHRVNFPDDSPKIIQFLFPCIFLHVFRITGIFFDFQKKIISNMRCPPFTDPAWHVERIDELNDWAYLPECIVL